MNKKEKAQIFSKASIDALKQIRKELESASKMHASQAKKLGGLLDGR